VNRATRDPYAGSEEALRERLRALTEEVQRNELLLRKTQAREIELLRAHSLGELFDRIVTGLRDAYGLDLSDAVAVRPTVRAAPPVGHETLSSAVSKKSVSSTRCRPWRRAWRSSIVPGSGLTRPPITSCWFRRH
jgi:uncharacterized protein YigA (DUF484 family)